MSAGDVASAGDPAPGRVGPPLPGTSETELDGRISVYAPGTDQVIMMSETAGDVWRLADGDLTLDQIVALLARAYGTTADEIAGDVRTAVQQFVEAGLIAPPRQ